MAFSTKYNALLNPGRIWWGMRFLIPGNAAKVMAKWGMEWGEKNQLTLTRCCQPLLWCHCTQQHTAQWRQSGIPSCCLVMWRKSHCAWLGVKLFKVSASRPPHCRSQIKELGVQWECWFDHRHYAAYLKSDCLMKDPVVSGVAQTLTILHTNLF